jgi:glycosyltransferase involved in cell wall biosynthesis
LELAAVALTPRSFAALAPNLSPGGAERHTIALARYGPGAELYCTGVALGTYARIDDAMAYELSNYAVIAAEPDPGHARHSLRHVKRRAQSLPDAVAQSCVGADVLIAWGMTNLAKFLPPLSIPVVLVAHCDVPASGPITGATHYVGVSRRALRHFLGSDPAVPRHVVFNGAEPHRIRPANGRPWMRAQWGFATDSIVCGNLARHAPEKNPEALLRALPYLPERYVAVYYGDDPKHWGQPLPALAALAKQLGVAHRVRFLSPTDQIGDVLAGLDVFTLLSRREANSLGLLEAFLAGVPVVATEVGAVLELEAEAGPLVRGVCDADDPRAVADALLDRPSAAWAHRVQALAAEYWTAPAMLRRWADYFEEIL